MFLWPLSCLPPKRSLALAFLCIILGDPKQSPLGSHLLQGRFMSFLPHPNSDVVVRLTATLVFPFKEDSRTHCLTCLLPRRHLFVGTDRLSVLFKVSHGREILVRPHTLALLETVYSEREARSGASWEPRAYISIGYAHSHGAACHPWVLYLQLYFVGVTVRLEQKYVHFTSTIHHFIPVPIGDTLPPRQVSGLCEPITESPPWVCVSPYRMADTGSHGTMGEYMDKIFWC